MKENSIEEAIKIMEHWIEYEKNNKEKINRADELINIQETILLNYKRALKENEILKKEKEQAWEEWNNLEQGSYETEQKLKQQIKKLQKENEELEEINNELEAEKNEAIRRYNFETIPIKKVKYKIEEYKNMLKTCNKAQDIDRIKAINERVLELQELLESEE